MQYPLVLCYISFCHIFLQSKKEKPKKEKPKKTNLLLLFVIIFICDGFFPIPSYGRDYIHIAAVTMSGIRRIDGLAMMQGINLYVDKINREGGINGRKIKLRIYDDNAQRRVAMKVASDIAVDNDILIVLGHFLSSTSISAGRIYKRSGIPVITASATVGLVTYANDWYFRVIPNNNFEGSFIASYISKSMKKQTACIIYDKDDYGASLAEFFEKAAYKLGLNIKKKWGFDIETGSLSDELPRILAELRSMDDPGVIFIASHSIEGIKIITSLKYPGTHYTIFGPDAFTTHSFINGFNKYPLERAMPGYYSDGIYAVSPFMVDIANESATKFRQEYIEKYKEEPSWVAASYYDATNVAVEAIRRAGVQGNIRKDRKEVRNALAEMYNSDQAIKGVTGYIYFDANGDMSGPLAVGFYERQKFIPAFSQYQLMNEAISTETAFDKTLEGNIILVQDLTMNQTKIVYTGIDIIEISDLDMQHGTFTAHFYLWFRFQDEYNDKEIIFTNSLEPIKLSDPILEKHDNTITTRTYEVTAKFKCDLNFKGYPFDSHTLRIQFHHAELKRNNLIYVLDTLALPSIPDKTDIEKIKMQQGTGWKIKNHICYQDIISNVSSLGIPEYFDAKNTISYSQFNAAVHIERNSVGTILRSITPVITIILTLYIIFYLPFDRIALQLLVTIGMLVTNACYHLKYLDKLCVDYLTTIEHIYLGIYVLLAIVLFWVGFVCLFQRKGKLVYVKYLVTAGKIVYPVLILLYFVWFMYAIVLSDYKDVAAPIEVSNVSEEKERIQ